MPIVESWSESLSANGLKDISSDKHLLLPCLPILYIIINFLPHQFVYFIFSFPEMFICAPHKKILFPIIDQSLLRITLESYMKSSESLPASLFDLEEGKVVDRHISKVSKIESQ